MFNELSLHNKEASSTGKPDRLPVNQVRNCSYKNDYNRGEVINSLVRVKQEQGFIRPPKLQSAYRNDYNRDEVTEWVKRSSNGA